MCLIHTAIVRPVLPGVKSFHVGNSRKFHSYLAGLVLQ